MNKQLPFVALAIAAFLFPVQAWATVYNFSCTTQGLATLITGNTAGTATVAADTAHLIYINGSCNANMCGGGQAYIEFDDKAMFAQALAAKVNGININVQIVRDTSSTAKGTTANGSSQCKVIALWY